MRIAYGGHPGAFGELACLARFPGADAIGHPDFETACAALLRADCDLAMIPFENSVAGEVPGVLDMIGSLPVTRVDVHAQPVVFHCLGLPGVQLHEIETVASHPMAIAECRHFLARIGAALASTRAAELYGLEVLEADVQDTADNHTLFAVLRRD